MAGVNLNGNNDSPVSNNGRGLKRLIVEVGTALDDDSPVSNNGRGLKPAAAMARASDDLDSPVSNNGRGLKLRWSFGLTGINMIRPLAITGVD